MWVQQKTPDTYSLATDDDGVFVIERGSGSKREAVQNACIDAKNTLRTQPVGSESDCHLFTASDLPESQQQAAKRLPTGSYDEVLAMLNRLADEALPVCVDGKQDKCREVK